MALDLHLGPIGEPERKQVARDGDRPLSGCQTIVPGRKIGVAAGFRRTRGVSGRDHLEPVAGVALRLRGAALQVADKRQCQHQSEREGANEPRANRENYSKLVWL